MKLRILLINLLFFSACFIKAQNTWTKMKNFPGSARVVGGSFVIKDKAYVVCGANGSTYLKDLWEYDLRKDTWIQKTSIPGNGRIEIFSFSIDSLGYIGNGQTQTSNPDNKVYSYNPRTNTWKAVANTPYSRGTRVAGSFTIGSKGYIFGGLPTGSAHSNKLYSYDPVSDKWTYETSLSAGSTGRTYSACVSHNGVGYILGGYDGSTYFDKFYKYDTGLNKIIELKAFPGNPLIGASMFVLNGKIYAGSGRTRTSILKDWFKYDICSNTWQQVTSSPSNHGFGSMFFHLNDTGYIVGGSDVFGNSSKEVYRYLPDTIQSKTYFTRPSIAGGLNCYGSRIYIKFTQNESSLTPGAKTLIEISDTLGNFTKNSKIIHSYKNSVCGNYTYAYTIPNNLSPSNKYRIRIRLSDPKDTSSVSSFFVIREFTLAKVKTPQIKEFCYGDSIRIELDAPTNNKLRWYINSDTTLHQKDTLNYLIVKETGSYKVYQKNINGCFGFSNSTLLKVKPRLYPKIHLSNSAFCPQISFSVFDSTTHDIGTSIVRRKWRFTLNDSSDVQKPSYAYNSDGKKVISLKIFASNGCSAETSKKIIVSPKPKAIINTDLSAGCIFNNTFKFINESQIFSGIMYPSWTNKFGVQLSTNDTFNTKFSFVGAHRMFLKVTSDKGCTDTTSKSIQVYPNPDARITSSKTKYCDKDTAVLKAKSDSTYSYIWSKDSNTIRGNSYFNKVLNSGSYSVEISNIYGCKSKSTPLYIHFNTLPKPNLGKDTSIAYEDRILLKAGLYQKYEWSLGSKTPSVNVDSSNLKIGENLIWVKVTDGNGCLGYDSITVTLQKSLDHKIISTKQAKIYPNPTSGKLFISLPKYVNREKVPFEILDLGGKQVRKGTLSDARILNIQGLNNGIYILRLFNDSEPLSFRIIKQ